MSLPKGLAPVRELGEKTIPNEKHKAYCYGLSAGGGYEIDPQDSRNHKVVQISEKDAKRAEYVWLLFWINGEAVAQFDLDGRIIAQPIRGSGPPPKRKVTNFAFASGSVDAVKVEPEGRRFAVEAPAKKASPASGKGPPRGAAPKPKGKAPPPAPKPQEPAPKPSHGRGTGAPKRRPRTPDPEGWEPL